MSDNIELKNQSMALRWVSDNIKNFGGNPNKITILGFNSSAIFAHYHYQCQL